MTFIYDKFMTKKITAKTIDFTNKTLVLGGFSLKLITGIEPVVLWAITPVFMRLKNFHDKFHDKI